MATATATRRRSAVWSPCPIVRTETRRRKCCSHRIRTALASFPRLAQSREESVAEEGEVAVGLGMRPVLNHLGGDVPSLEIYGGDEADQPRIAGHWFASRAADLLGKPL